MSIVFVINQPFFFFVYGFIFLLLFVFSFSSRGLFILSFPLLLQQTQLLLKSLFLSRTDDSSFSSEFLVIVLSLFFQLKNSFCLMSWIEVAAYFSERMFSNSKGKNQMSACCFSIYCYPLWSPNHHNFSTISIFPFMDLQGILIIFYNKLLFDLASSQSFLHYFYLFILNPQSLTVNTVSDYQNDIRN